MSEETENTRQLEQKQGTGPDNDSSRPSYVQVSFRLTPETLESIRQMAITKGISQSEVMRKAATLLSHTDGLEPNVKLAAVDIEDHTGPDHYRVVSWLLVD